MSVINESEASAADQDVDVMFGTHENLQTRLNEDGQPASLSCLCLSAGLSRCCWTPSVIIKSCNLPAVS